MSVLEYYFMLITGIGTSVLTVITSDETLSSLFSIWYDDHSPIQ